MSRWLARILAALAALAPIWPGVRALGAARGAAGDGPRPGGPASALEEQLRGLAGGDLRISRHTRTGRIRFVSPLPGGSFPASPEPARSTKAIVAALEFLEAYGGLFGVRDPSRELRTIRTREASGGRSFVRFRQIHHGVPVLGGEFVVQLDGSRHVRSVHGEVLPDLDVETTAGVSSDEARWTAAGFISRLHALALEDLSVSRPRLWLYNPVLLGPGPDATALVWRVEVRSAEAGPVREMVLVDARRGGVLWHLNQVATLARREIWDNSNRRACERRSKYEGQPGCEPARREVEGPAGVPDVDAAYDHAGDTRDFFMNRHGRDLGQDREGKMIVVVRYCPPWRFLPCPYANAFWDGARVGFGDGFALADDVVGHEFTHAVTDQESGLFYYMQSGAINEALSDIWGEFIDLSNGTGDDSEAVRWLIGEDLDPDGFRNMRDPAAAPHFDPDRVGSPHYKCSGQDFDNGGVHSNSGVVNKIASLLADGGTFNGSTISPLGLDRTAALFYEVQTNWLTSGSDFNDLNDALEAACLGMGAAGDPSGLTLADCEEVGKALDATEMHLPEPCDSRIEAPLCPAGQSPSHLLFDDLEAGCAGWKWNRRYPERSSYSDTWECPAETYASSGAFHLRADPPWSTAVDESIAMDSDVSLPAGTSYLRFEHAHGFQFFLGEHHDGGVVEYSTDRGRTWHDAGPLADLAGYDGRIEDCCGNPLGGRAAFVGESHGYYASRLNLSPLAGRRVRFRFRVGTDEDGDIFEKGWFLDDVAVYTCAGPDGPDVIRLSPATAARGEPGFSLTVTGAGFTPASTVLWGGAPRATAFVSATELRAAIPEEDVREAGAVEIAVRDPSGDGTVSHPLRFTIGEPCPPAAPLAARTSGVVEDGDCASPWVRGSRADLYAFEGVRGEKIRIRMSSREFATALGVVGPDGRDWASRDCKERILDACLTIRSLPATGTYRVVATSWWPGSGGSYRLTLRRGR